MKKRVRFFFEKIDINVIVDQTIFALYICGFVCEQFYVDVQLFNALDRKHFIFRSNSISLRFFFNWKLRDRSTSHVTSLFRSAHKVELSKMYYAFSRMHKSQIDNFRKFDIRLQSGWFLVPKMQIVYTRSNTTTTTTTTMLPFFYFFLLNEINRIYICYQTLRFADPSIRIRIYIYMINVLSTGCAQCTQNCKLNIECRLFSPFISFGGSATHTKKKMTRNMYFQKSHDYKIGSICLWESINSIVCVVPCVWHTLTNRIHITTHLGRVQAQAAHRLCRQCNTFTVIKCVCKI